MVNSKKNKDNDSQEMTQDELKAQAESQAEELVTTSTASCDMLWKQWEQTVDEWNERSAQAEDVYASFSNQWIESCQNMQANAEELTEKAACDVRQWEKVAREELLSSTAAIRYLVPFQSFEDTNRVMDTYWDQAIQLSTSPLRFYSTLFNHTAKQWKDSTDQAIDYSRGNREKAICAIKEVSSSVQEQQGRFFQEYEKQVKSLFFPISRYIDKSDEMSANMKKKA
jgi:hypothetical protein